MKKIILATLVVTFLGIFLALKVNIKTDRHGISSLTLENIEALAQGEGDPGDPGGIPCYKPHQYVAAQPPYPPFALTIIRCSDCGPIVVTSHWGPADRCGF